MYEQIKYLEAIVNQREDKAPTMLILENSIGKYGVEDAEGNVAADVDFHWHYDQAGNFTLRSPTGIFKEDKTTATLELTNADIQRTNLQGTPDGIIFEVLQVYTDPENGRIVIQPTDGMIVEATLRIKIYP